MLTGSPFIQLTATFVRRFAELRDIMRLYTDALAFDSALTTSTEAAIELQIAMAALSASVGLEAGRAALYVDLVLNSISEANRQALQAMNPPNYTFQSEFVRRYFFLGEVQGAARGKAEGKAEGKVELLINLATH